MQKLKRKHGLLLVLAGFFLIGVSEVLAGNSLIGKLEETQKALHQMSPGAYPCLTERSGTITDEEFNSLFSKCARAVCGPPDHGKLAIDLRDRNLAEVQAKVWPLFKRDLAPLISENFRISHRELAALKVFERLMDQPSEIRINAPDYIFHNLSFLGNQQKKLGWKWNGSAIVFDPEQTRENFTAAFKSTDLVTRAVDVLMDIFQTDKVSVQEYLKVLTQFSLTHDKPALYFSRIYPNLSLKDALIKDAQDLNKILEIGRKSSIRQRLIAMGQDLTDFGRPDLIKKAAGGEDMSQEEIKDYLGSRLGIQYLNLVGESSKVGEQLIVSDFRSFIETTELKKRVIEYRRVLESPQALFEIKKKAYDQANVAYTTMSAYLPTTEQIEAGKASAEASKEAIKKKVIPHFSETTQKLMKHAIDHTDFRFPESFQQYHDRMVQNLRKHVAHHSDIDKKDEESIKQSLIYQIYNLQSVGRMIDEVVDLFEVGSGVQLITDHYRTSTGRIEVSKGCVMMPESCRSIILHELGHRLSDQVFSKPGVSEMSMKKFVLTNECLDSRYKNEPNYTVKKYEEEDWSDLVSALSLESNEAAFPCWFMQRDANNHSYSPLFLQQSESSDTHSALLFRALHMYKTRFNQLPDECESALQTLKDPPQFSSCLTSDPE